MTKIKFEYRITLAYLLIGSIWIIFSDRFLGSIIEDTIILTEIQTYKGWFYVSFTAVLFFLFIRKHLKNLRNTEKELENHKNNLQELVMEKTRKLDDAVSRLSATNKELNEKSEIINNQNIELKKTLRDLKDTQAQLLQADKMASLGVLTAGVAHEINNPLNYILGGLTGLEKHFRHENIPDKKITLFLSSIKTGIERVNSIISGLNQFSRDRDTYTEVCDIHEIINNCLTIINHQLAGRIQVFNNFADAKLTVLGNAGQLHQIFVNILVNASQSIGKKGSINIETSADEENVSIEITDTGCGIKMENLSKITDPFFTTKEPGKGTGLGLAITYNLIKAHKGNITFESELKKGTSVKIVLPNDLKNHA